VNIVNVGYDSTNYYVLADKQPRLLIDVGFPGTLPKLQKQCKQKGVELAAIPYLLCTHYHPDHAGLAEELKRTGVKLIVLDLQLAAISVLKMHMKPEYGYVEIGLKDNTVITLDESRAFLGRLGIEGEIVATPGHTDDCVSLVLDDGTAFTGDLIHPLMATDAPDDPVRQSWDKLRALGVKTVYPGHGPVQALKAPTP
jgi:glyoxylase-like metal-dependent hydrolase (beta-lactamase superfamily II)